MEYLIKVSAILIVFYACYKLLLNRETFFESNRSFLLLGLITAFILPLITISKYIMVEPVIIKSNNVYNELISEATTTENTIPITTILSYLYLAGVTFFLGRFLLQFSSLIILLLKSTKQRVASYIYVITKNAISPFSFFNWIVFNPNQFDNTELKQIITHEKVHAKQLHSIDILLSELTGIILWFNPLVWLYKKDLKQNLEFIADKNAQANTNCKKSYQHLLLKTSVPNYQVALTNNFYNSSIKKRIVMLHKNKSHKRNQLKFLLVLPALVLFLMSFNTKEIYIQAETQEKEPSAISQKAETIASTSSNTKTLMTNNKPVATKTTNKIVKTNSLITQDIVAYFIESTFTDADLDNLVTKLKKHGVTLKIKGVNRDSDNKITSIKIEAKSDNSNANFSISNDSAIKTVKITYNANDDSISIGNSYNLLHSDNHTFTKIKKTGKGSNTFAYSVHDEHESKHEIIESDNTIIIKNGNKVSELKKGNKDENVFVISGSKGKKYEIIHADTVKSSRGSYKLKGNVIIESKGKGEGKSIFVTSGNDNKIIELKEKKGDNGDVMFIKKEEDGNIIKERMKIESKNISFKSDDGKVYKIQSTGNGNSNIWINKGDSKGKTITKIGKNGGTMFFTSDSKKKPLVVVDDKVVKYKILEDIDPDSIESMTVLKGSSAKEKYGKKGKDGVIEITLKKSKN
ncbi:M56 family metallopeptidase [Pontimicrobium aquaticum]|uniref:Peptidase M56 domain-containing protein n=1 Tax=Pontimicrobium aquaticum TaxID=2565367 RepID=A0A4U0EZC2_9FLAO|nr:M56 family metallopeptidase [Pontimicrobium aquaticum]TJY37278.1 hypothetical protein E5167_04845 [Pontimicrobium aquaticum]